MKVANKLWNLYRHNGWVPTIITVGLLLLPSLFLQIIFTSQYGTSQSALIDGLLPAILVGVPWLLALASLVMMFFAGIYQLKNNMRLKGTVNLVVSLILFLLFIVPITLFFISPPGVN